MKIEFELKPDYDKIVFKTIQGIIWSILIGIWLTLPSWIVGEPIYIPIAKWFGYGPIFMWGNYLISGLIAIAIYVIVVLTLWLLVKLVATLIYSIQEIGKAYSRYDKKQWMENRDNIDKCIFCKHYHYGKKYCDHGWGKNFAKLCVCSVYKPLKFDTETSTEDMGKENYPNGEIITGNTSGAKITYRDIRYCTKCGKIFEAKRSNPTDICDKCNGIDTIEEVTKKSFPPFVSAVPYERSGYRAIIAPASEAPTVTYAKKDKNGHVVIQYGTDETHDCLLIDDCKNHSTGWYCECEKCINSVTDVVFTYYCQLSAHRDIGRPHNIWKPPLPPDYTQDDHNSQLMCLCNNKWGQHTEKGKCTRCDCEYFIEQKEYLNCPGCGEKGETSYTNTKDDLRCTLLNSECKIWTWNKYTHEVTYESE